MEKLHVAKRSLGNLANNNQNFKKIGKKQKNTKNRPKNTKNRAKYQNFLQILKKYALQICICLLLFALLFVLAFLSFDGKYFIFLNRPKLFLHPQKFILLFALNFIAVFSYYLYNVWVQIISKQNGQIRAVPLAQKDENLPTTKWQMQKTAKLLGLGIKPKKILSKLLNNYFLFTILLFSLFGFYFLFFNIHLLALCVISIFLACFVCLNRFLQNQNVTPKIILALMLLLFICNFLSNYLLFMLN